MTQKVSNFVSSVTRRDTNLQIQTENTNDTNGDTNRIPGEDTGRDNRKTKHKT